MPRLGDIRGGSSLGYISRGRLIWAACMDCGKERWSAQTNDKPRALRCRACARKWNSGERNHYWKGGRNVSTAGYVLIWLSPNDFFYPMATTGGYVLEHRLVMAKHLKRCLLPWEIVHHKGIRYSSGSKENKSDNRIENLALIKGPGKHNTAIEQALKRQAKEIGILQQRVTLLEAENILLKEEVGNENSYYK